MARPFYQKINFEVKRGSLINRVLKLAALAQSYQRLKVMRNWRRGVACKWRDGVAKLKWAGSTEASSGDATSVDGKLGDITLGYKI